MSGSRQQGRARVVVLLVVAAVGGGVYWFLTPAQKGWIATTASDWAEQARRWVDSDYAERVAAAEAKAAADAAAQRARDEQVAELSRQGIAAAERKQVDLAIQTFHEARQIAPHSPAVLLNLALAYDMGGKWDAAAISCYRAYLAAAPDAQNLEQVRGRIVVLERRIEDRVVKMVEVVRSILGELPPKTYDPDIHADLASALMLIGRSAEAKRIDAQVRGISAYGAEQCGKAIADAEAKVAQAMGAIRSSDPYDAGSEIAAWMMNLEVHPYKQEWIIDPAGYVASMKAQPLLHRQLSGIALSAGAHALVHLELRKKEHEWAQRRSTGR